MSNKPVKPGTIQLITVDSKEIHAAGYDEQNRIMVVLFNTGKVYSYFNVPRDVYEDFMKSETKGGYIRFIVTGRYPCKIGRRSPGPNQTRRRPSSR